MSSATSAPIELKFDEETFYMSPLTIADCEELDRWVQGKFLGTARASFTPEMTSEDRKEILEAAMQTAAQLTFMSQAGMKMFATLQGIAKLFEISVRAKSPSITYQRACMLMMAPESLSVFQVAFDKLNALSRSGGRSQHPTKVETKEDRKRRKAAKLRRR